MTDPNGAAILMVTWIPSIYPSHVSITSTMDPSWVMFLSPHVSPWKNPAGHGEVDRRNTARRVRSSWTKCRRGDDGPNTSSLGESINGLAFYSDLMAFYSDLTAFYSDLMAFYSDLMAFYSDLMTFYSDLMGYTLR